MYLISINRFRLNTEKKGGNAKDDKNNIQVLNPGETKTVAWAFFVDEECLPYLYLNVTEDDTYDSFSENVLDIGYVDIRQ